MNYFTILAYFASEGFTYFLSVSKEDAVIKHYTSLGYVWKRHPDPDPGHPCAGAFTTLSW